ncbi:MAG: hypothetical protein QOH22_1342, partial [Gemmatimonadaceae bacterium]|nr:hypothetical protein [Gemmatimonadaceae bacterium]
AQPMSVRERVMGTGRGEKAFRFQPSIGEWLIRMMSVVSEATFQAAAKTREMREPAPVRGKLIAVRQTVVEPDPFERQVGERSRGLTDREARMRSPLEEDDVVTEHRQHAGEE